MVGDHVGGRKTSHRVQSQCHMVGRENEEIRDRHVSKEELITLWDINQSIHILALATKRGKGG